MLILVLALLAWPAQALISQPLVEAEVQGPTKAHIVWDVPSEAVDEKAVTAWQLQVADNLSFDDPVTKTYDAETLSTILTKSDGLKSVDQIYVRVKGLYADGDASNYGSTSFYTPPAKITSLKVKKNTTTMVKVKWKKPPRAADELHYDLKLYRLKAGGKKKLVAEDDVYGQNSAQFTGLTLGKKRYAFKVRARHDSKYGTGKWSDLKSFRTVG